MPGMLPRVVVVVSAIGAIAPVAASDAPLQRALSQAACAGSRVERLSDQGSMAVYRVDCSGAPNRRMIVVCMRDFCRVAPEQDKIEE